MAEQETPTLRKVAWTELLPWLNLVRCFRIAIQLRLLACAAVGIFLMLGGWALLGYLFSGNERIQTELDPWAGCPWVSVTEMIPDRPDLPQTLAGESLLVSPGGFDSPEALLATEGPARRAGVGAKLPPRRFWGAFSPSLGPLWGAWAHVSGPWRQIFGPADPSLTFTDRLVKFVFFLFCGIWALAVWAFFGGVITRAAAVELATHDRAKTGRTLRFAAAKYRAYFAAPFFPLLGVLLIGVPIALVALFLRPEITIWVAAILWPLLLLAGFLMALLLMGLLFGWPLMWANISTEGVDSFDAVGRAYNYVFQRPLHYLFYAIVATVLGALGWLLVSNFAAAIVGLTYGSAAWTGSGSRLQEIAAGSANLGAIGGFGAWLIRFWVGCVKFLGAGFLYSYFWTASTATYFLLRRDADATEMDEVCPEEEEQPAEPLPPVRTDAAGAPVVDEKLPENQAE